MSWRVWLAIAVTAGFSVLTLMSVDLSALPEALAAIHLWSWLLALPLFVSAHLVRGLRWAPLLEPVASPPLRRVVAYAVVGMWISDILPLRAGEFYRVWLLKSREGVSIRSGLATVVVERSLDGLLVVGLLIVATSLLNLHDPLFVTARLGGLALFGGILAILLVAAFAPVWTTNMTMRLGRRLPDRLAAALGNTVQKGIAGLEALRHPRLLLAVAARSVVLWGLMAVFYFLMMRAMGLHATPAGAMLLLAAISLSMVLPTVPSHVGVYHYVAMSVLVLLGATNAEGLALAVVLHLTELLITLLMGAGIMLTMGLASPRRARLQSLDSEGGET